MRATGNAHLDRRDDGVAGSLYVRKRADPPEIAFRLPVKPQGQLGDHAERSLGLPTNKPVRS